MTAIHETAYPRLKTEYSLEELTAVYTPSTAEIEYVFNLYRQVGPRTFMLVKLKLLQRLGYFVPLATVPEEIIEHICSQANLRKPAKRAITLYDQSGTRALQHQRLRAYLGLQLVDQKAEKWLENAATHAARTK